MSDKEEKRSSEKKSCTSNKSFKTDCSDVDEDNEKSVKNPPQSNSMEPVQVKPFANKCPKIKIESKNSTSIK